MSNHTPEPWRVGRPGTVVSDTPVPGMGGSDAVEYYGGHLIGESIIEANARRIVACVNACEGIETEQLERQSLKDGKILGLVGSLKREISNQKDRYNSLLALVWVAVDRGVIPSALSTKCKADKKLITEIHDAIAKAKGGAE